MRLIALGIVSAFVLWGQSDSVLDHFYNLEYDQAISEVEKEIAARPNDAELHNILAECIQFREMFRVGALESELVSGANSFLRRPKIDTTPQIEKQFFDEIEKAMDLSQAQLKKNPNDTKPFIRWASPTACAPTGISWSGKLGATRYTTPQPRGHCTPRFLCSIRTITTRC